MNSSDQGWGSYYSEVKDYWDNHPNSSVADYFIWEAEDLASRLDNNLEDILRDHLRDDLIIDISGPVFDEDSFNQNVYIGISKDAYNSYGPMNNLEHFRWVEASIGSIFSFFNLYFF